MASIQPGTRALVLGGGGVAGIAWEVGVLLGLYEQGVDLRNADLLIGTSAGSTVGAQITSGSDLEHIFALQLIPAEQSKERMVAFEPTRMMEAFRQAVGEFGSDARAIRARIGAYALARPTISEAERREIVASRLPSLDWPPQRFLIVTIDTATGEPWVIDRHAGVSLVDAVAASCAVPGIWPPVTIGDRRYMDGGVRSSTNADLAAGFERVVILKPLKADVDLPGSGPTIERANLERTGSSVLVIEPDDEAVAALGLNPLDPATREPSAQAGRRQGHALAASVAAFWSA